MNFAQPILSQTPNHSNTYPNSQLIGTELNESQQILDIPLNTIQLVDSLNQMSAKSQNQVRRPSSRQRSRAERREARNYDERETAQRRNLEKLQDFGCLSSQTKRHEGLGTQRRRKYDKLKQRAVQQPVKRSRRIFARNRRYKNEGVESSLPRSLSQEDQIQAVNNPNNEKNTDTTDSSRMKRVPIFHTKIDLNTDSILRFLAKCNEDISLTRNQIDVDLILLEEQTALTQAVNNTNNRNTKHEKFS